MIDINSVLSDRKKTWSILSFVILCALAFVLLFKHDFGNFRKIKLGIAESIHNKATLDSLSEYKKYLKEFNAYLVSGNGLDWLIGTLTVLSKNNGVTLSAVKPFETERSSGYEIVKVSIGGTSSYRALLRLIEALEDSKENILIESISIRLIESGSSASVKNPSVVLEGSMSRNGSVGFNAIIASVVREI